jgi:uncharacterized UPF0146 family protein
MATVCLFTNILQKRTNISAIAELQAKDEDTKHQMQAKLTELDSKLAEREERIKGFQDDFTKHTVPMLKLATIVYSLRMRKPK